MLTTLAYACLPLMVLFLASRFSYFLFVGGGLARMGVDVSHLLAFLCGLLLLPALKAAIKSLVHRNDRNDAEARSVYGLEHGRLHLENGPMWMNMGYWALKSSENTMAEACRDLLVEILDTAGFTSECDSIGRSVGARKTKCLIDLGFGCGDQTIFLTDSADPESNKETGDGRSGTPRFDEYVGLTIDEKQYHYATSRITKARSAKHRRSSHEEKVLSVCTKVRLFCTDAARPESWNQDLETAIQSATNNTQEHWVLALDTAYHFSPSRWPVIKYACQTLDASYMAFDLCISPTITFPQKALLRLLTGIMGAPWANFVTPDEYRRRLVDAGYENAHITIRDISEDVFGPLAAFMESQDQKLRLIGFSLGPFNLARLMFRWWAQGGAVRGVIVVANKRVDES